MKKTLIAFLLIFIVGCKAPVKMQKNESYDTSKKETLINEKITDHITNDYSDTEELLRILRNRKTKVTISEYEPITATDSLGNTTTTFFKKKESIFDIDDKTETVKGAIKSDSTLITVKTIDVASLKSDEKITSDIKTKETPKDPYRLRYVFYILVALLVGVFLIRRFFF